MILSFDKLKERFMVFGDYWVFMNALFVKVGIVSASDGWVWLITREKAQNRGIWHKGREKINSSKYIDVSKVQYTKFLLRDVRFCLTSHHTLVYYR